MIHPRLLGNGRTQHIFFEHLLAHCGYGDTNGIKLTIKVWIQANIDGFNCRLMDDRYFLKYLHYHSE